MTLLILIILSTSFYWFEFRPSQIRKECTEEASVILQIDLSQEDNEMSWNDQVRIKFGLEPESSGYNNEEMKQWEWIYEVCLQRNGLEK